MTAVDEGMTGDDLDELADLLPDDAAPVKKGALPVKRTAKQIAAAQARAEAAQKEADLRSAQDAAKAKAARLAQIVNLHIAGFSLAEIGASTGHTAGEIDRMLSNDMARYVRSQPALRTYVRNFISSKYTDLLEAVWDEATDKTHVEKLENSAQALRILKEMSRLHGAEAPVQSEVKVDTAPEAVERLVSRLAAQQGLGYDMDIFDTVPGTVVHEAAVQSHAALESSSDDVEQEQPDDRPL